MSLTLKSPVRAKVLPQHWEDNSGVLEALADILIESPIEFLCEMSFDEEEGVMNRLFLENYTNAPCRVASFTITLGQNCAILYVDDVVNKELLSFAEQGCYCTAMTIHDKILETLDI